MLEMDGGVFCRYVYLGQIFQAVFAPGFAFLSTCYLRNPIMPLKVKPESMEDQSKSYRDSMITATGIILGFLLNFETAWVKSDTPLNDAGAFFVGICLLIGTLSLILVLYRMLNIRKSGDSGERYYSRTLWLFIAGITIMFLGVFVDMFSNFMVE